MKNISVLIADDQALVRDGLKMILGLEKDMTIAGTSRNGVEACEMAERLQPDVVLLDVRMPAMDGIACVGIIRAKSPNTKIIMLTTFNDDQYILQALANHANGYILKDIELDKLVEAIHDAVQGKMVLPPEVASRLSEGLSKIRTPKSKENILSNDLDLSQKERAVAEMMAQGFTNKQIASALYMAEGTVRNYVSSLYARIGTHDRTQAVLFLKQQGFSGDE